MRHAIVGLVAILIGGSIAGAVRAAPGGGAVPEVLPQWTHDLPAPIDYYSLDARPRVGALVNARDQLIALAPDGAVRWITHSCPECSSSQWISATLTADGGAWALESAPEFETQRLVRIDAAGRIEWSVPLQVQLYPVSQRQPLFGNSDQAVVLDGVGHGVRWQRADLASGTIEERTIVISNSSYFRFADAHPLPDGGVSVAFGSSCGDIPVCPPPPVIYSIARIDATGTMLWHVEGGGNAALDSRGGGNVVLTGQDGFKYLRRVMPSGEVGPDILLEGLDYVDRWPRVFLSGPYAGNLALIVTSDADVTNLWSIDLAGHVGASRTFNDYLFVLDDSPLGLVVRNVETGLDTAQWLDPLSLEALAYFRVPDDGAGGQSTFGATRLLRDGNLYGMVAVPGASEVADKVLGRFIAPGFTAADRRDHAQAGRALLRHYADPGTPRLHDRAVPGRDRMR